MNWTWLSVDVLNGIGTTTGFFLGFIAGKYFWLRRRKREQRDGVR